MSFDAGSVNARVILDTKNYDDGIKKVDAGSKSMTASMFKAQVAFELAQKALQGLVNIGKTAIKNYADSEKNLAQLNAVLKSTKNAAGLTAKEITSMASSLSKMTTFEDDAILSAQNLLLTFTNIKKDVFPQATQTVLDMSAALGQDLKGSSVQLGKALQDPITGITALRRVGVNFNETQQSTIKYLVETNRLEEAQTMILKELQTEFGGSATAIRQTFGGALEALKNQQGEVLESAGKVISVFGIDIVNSMIAGTEAIQNYIESAKGIETISNISGGIGGSFEVAKTIFADFGKVIKTSLTEAIKGISEKFKTLFGNIETGNQFMFVLSGAVKAVGISFKLVVNVIKITINYIMGLIDIARDAIVLLKDFFIAMSNPFDKKGWEQAGKSLTEVADSVKETYKTLIYDVGDTIQETAKELKSLPADTEKLAKDIGNAWNKGFSESKAKMQTSLTQGATATGTIPVVDASGGSSGMTTGQENALIAEQGYEGMASATGSSNERLQEEMEEKISIVSDYYNTLASAVQIGLQGVQDIASQYYANETSIVENEYSKQMSALNAKFKAGKISEEEYAKEKEKIDKKKAKALYKIQKEQFEAEKALKIANIWLSWAQGTMSAWQSAMSYPFPANVAIGAAMTALLTGFAIASTVLVAQQQAPAPAFAEGGIVQGARGIDKIDAKLTDGELILNKAQQSNINEKLTAREATPVSSQPLQIQLVYNKKIIDEINYDSQKQESLYK
jgi:ElaB/YqjD/DUF883 family membrane-anchored ribosome-binding protein